MLRKTHPEKEQKSTCFPPCFAGTANGEPESQRYEVRQEDNTRANEQGAGGRNQRSGHKRLSPFQEKFQITFPAAGRTRISPLLVRKTESQGRKRIRCSPKKQLGGGRVLLESLLRDPLSPASEPTQPLRGCTQTFVGLAAS